jgi:threonine/homoserine/homoserine lactone efflux protein
LDITVIFLLGLIIAFVGVIPPGLLNMTAAKVSLKEGAARGVLFSIGVCIVVCLQTYLAAIFAKYLSNHPEVVEILQRVALVIFILITIYFLLLARKQPKPDVEANVRSKHRRFFQGMLLSALNVFPIPYHAYMTITLASFGLLTFETYSVISYVAGATTGTFVMLYIYIFFFDRIKNEKLTSQKSMNYIIGTITGVIAIVTLINIIKDF